jgi:hypothetical protein
MLSVANKPFMFNAVWFGAVNKFFCRKFCAFSKKVVKKSFLYSEKSVWLLLQILYFKLQVIDKSYRQVLTPVNNSQLLLKLEIPDKLRLVTFLKTQHKETATS